MQKLVPNNPNVSPYIRLLDEADDLTWSDKQMLALGYWKADPYRFITDCIYTIDETKAMIRKFPEKKYLKRIIDVYRVEKKIVVPKSRRMMLSWVTATWLLHRVLLFPNSTCYWQSKKKEESNYVLQERIFIMYNHLPQWIKDIKPVTLNNAGFPTQYDFEITHDKQNKITSHVYSESAGADQVRGKTATIIVSDEFAFQERQSEALASVTPTTEGGGQLIIISSAKLATVFELLVKDELEGKAR